MKTLLVIALILFVGCSTYQITINVHTQRDTVYVERIQPILRNDPAPHWNNPEPYWSPDSTLRIRYNNQRLVIDSCVIDSCVIDTARLHRWD